ncbi:MAG: ectoine hydroxylase [Rhodobacteraceae bacterium]|jgi:ectoine hydroxylase|uniref:Ectoine hydroxylase n=1 Tax=Salipiger profundus TaxID=1229727 RepID=A0A1U7D9V3_9RHOB|nr:MULTISPECIES: ectoine hydroxylase [Salipiger]APX24840.1 ectoine hydroxylase [Salipiger profundus]MAB07756.1 ectoine hydroxylase [Paracoccaceae bacterium]GFZ98164.1 ectoine hydroxylase [Salipiger profundus]SFC97614.1 ectoine hydroxylase [Salipiger profundus]
MPLEYAPRDTRDTLEADAYPTRTPEPERWIERVDPVVWQDWTEKAPISQAEAERFDRDGFLVLKDLFSPEEVRALVDRAAALRADGDALAGEDVVTEPGSNEVRTIFRLEAQDEMMSKLARDRRLAGIARFLLGDEVYVHQSRLNYKPGFTGKEFYWHSDFETWHAEDGMPRMRALSASLLLTDNRAHNGALMLMPGSHKVFVSCQGETPEDNHKSSLQKQEIGTPSPESLADLAKMHGIADAEGPAGTLFLFDCNTIHGSNGNITPDPRSNAFFVYNAVSNRLQAPFAASKNRPDFLANLGDPEPLELHEGRFD